MPKPKRLKTRVSSGTLDLAASWFFLATDSAREQSKLRARLFAEYKRLATEGQLPSHAVRGWAQAKADLGLKRALREYDAGVSGFGAVIPGATGVAALAAADKHGEFHGYDPSRDDSKPDEPVFTASIKQQTRRRPKRQSREL
jgi:hypothetical protein